MPSTRLEILCMQLVDVVELPLDATVRQQLEVRFE